MPPPSPVVVYCGHMFEHGSPEEPALAARIAVALDKLGATEAYGLLACGADIMIAEAMLARGGTLHVVLPFAEDNFIAESVVCGGSSWLPRYRACRAAAASLHFSTPGSYIGDDNQFAYATRMAMGLASLRAHACGGEAVQLAVFAKGATSFSQTGLAGTAADTGVWERFGNRTVTIEAGTVGRDLKFPPRQPPPEDARREIRSIIFADYKGFSRLDERHLPLFMREVMGRIGEVLDGFGAHVEFRNSWGDAVYVIVDQPTIAARIALALQDRLSDLPAELSPPGAIAGMRIGLHYGPIFVGRDRVTEAPLWYGGEVNRTARIEPVTPVGGTYCTETFAAALLMDGCVECSFTSVGAQPLAKNFGVVELYRIDHLGQGDA